MLLTVSRRCSIALILALAALAQASDFVARHDIAVARHDIEAPALASVDLASERIAEWAVIAHLPPQVAATQAPQRAVWKTEWG